MIASTFKAGVVLIVVLVFQVELFSDMRFFGIMPELLLGAAIAGGWAGGPDRGAIVGFSAGMLYDLYLPTPLALSALSYMLIGFAVGTISAGIAESGEKPLRRAVSFVALPVGITLFVVLGELLGQDLYTDTFVKLIIIATLYTALLLGPVHLGMRWAFGVDRRDARTPMRLEMVE